MLTRPASSMGLWAWLGRFWLALLQAAGCKNQTGARRKTGVGQGVESRCRLREAPSEALTDTERDLRADQGTVLPEACQRRRFMGSSPDLR